MGRVLYPTTFMLDSDQRTVWGHVRATVDNHTLLRVELCMEPDLTKAGATWAPFCSLTIVEGRVAFRIHGKHGVREGVLNGDTVSYGPHPTETARKLTLVASDRNTPVAEGDDLAVRTGEVGEDPRNPNGEG